MFMDVWRRLLGRPVNDNALEHDEDAPVVELRLLDDDTDEPGAADELAADESAGDDAAGDTRRGKGSGD